MENIKKYDISFYGEFVDKALEREFFIYDMSRCAKFIGSVSLVFGIIYMMFLVFDFYSINNTSSFIFLLTIRVLIFIISAALYFTIKKTNNYSNLVYLITTYEIIAVGSFLIIINQYESFTYLTLFSVISIALAVYVMPNKLINAQIISVLFILCFFVFFAKNMEGLKADELIKVAAYIFLIIIFCNISAYMTNFYKRNIFADSRELLRMSITDSLTGIYNRAKLGEELNRLINSCNSYENPLSLVIFDIDDFKRINDNYGHHIGDCVLQNIVSTIKEEIRSCDIFARWGGEEFVILLPNTDITEAMEITERMRICIQKSKYGIVENITCSFGLAALRKYENAEALMQRADKLLYDAKNIGKNVVICEDFSELALNNDNKYAGI